MLILENFSAHFLEIFSPAENNAISGFFDKTSFILIILLIFFLNNIFFPIDFLEADKYNFFIGNFLFSNNLTINLPTIPVAPIIATFFFLNIYFIHSVSLSKIKYIK